MSRLEKQLCDWCTKPMPRDVRSDAITCSKSCRQARSRFRVVAAASTPGEAMSFAYADPPYIGLAKRYYSNDPRCAEVDHDRLVRLLVDGWPHGWALSASSKSLPLVLRIIDRYVEPARVRVCPWVKGSRSGVSWFPRNAWEPLIVVGGRPRHLAVRERCDDVLVWGGRQHSHPNALVGMKPAQFCEWMFRMLGAAPGDTLTDLFPGSGSVRRAWRLFTSRAA